MALFSADTTTSLEEDVTKGLAQLGAGGAAFGAGHLLKYPIDANYQRKLVQKALELNAIKEQSRENWDTMLKLYRGKLSMNDIPEEKREFYERLLKENADDLKYLSNNPYEVKQTLDQFNHGKVIPLFGEAKMTRNFPDKVHSPTGKALPGLLGLAGAYTAGQLYDHMHENNHTKE